MAKDAGSFEVHGCPREDSRLSGGSPAQGPGPAAQALSRRRRLGSTPVATPVGPRLSFTSRPSATSHAESPGKYRINKKVGRIGGYVRYEDRDLAPGEALWRLAIGKEDVEGRFALRGGVFVVIA
jgi:hypothetical protein